MKFLLALALIAGPTIHADATAPVQPSEPTVATVQAKLRSFGYTVTVDGNAQARQTVRAVAHWQSVNDLRVSGTITAEVLRTLGIRTAAQAVAPAVRLSVPTGIHGLPFAPEGLDRCQEMNFYRVQWGLPERFSDQPRVPQVSFARQGLGWRESNCRNDVISSTGCCGGYWQLYISLFARDSRMRPRLADCNVSALSDVTGNEPLDKQRNACVAKALYDLEGLDPWAL
jgi:hypothetical protein